MFRDLCMQVFNILESLYADLMQNFTLILNLLMF